MAVAGRFLQPLRVPLSVYYLRCSAASPIKISFGNHQHLKVWINGVRPILWNHMSRFQRLLSIQVQSMKKQRISGGRFSMGSICGMSLLSVWMNPGTCVAHALDGIDIFPEEHHANLSDSENLWEDDPFSFWVLARKLWLPAVLILTVLMSWDHPISLVAKVILFLLSTKPNPFSVYVSIEQLRHQSTRRKYGWYKSKPSYAKKVEVEDYKLLCLARVELEDKKINLIGILGSWWVLQSAPYQEAFSSFWNRVMNGG